MERKGLLLEMDKTPDKCHWSSRIASFYLGNDG